MAEADWTECSDGLASGSVARGVTAGLGVPPGGGSFVYGFHSKDVSIGAVALFCNLTDFAPTSKGASVRGVLSRRASGGNTGFSAFLFAGLQGSSVNDYGYMLGLSDANPSHIVLRKGQLVAGVVDLAPDAPSNGIMRRSSETVAIDAYVHLRLDMVVNTNGDVRLQVFKNDLVANPIGSAPVWTAIAGMSEFVDDALAVNSGSAPYTSGRCGFGFRTSDVTRRAVVDQIEVIRQL